MNVYSRIDFKTLIHDVLSQQNQVKLKRRTILIFNDIICTIANELACQAATNLLLRSEKMHSNNIISAINAYFPQDMSEGAEQYATEFVIRYTHETEFNSVELLSVSHATHCIVCYHDNMHEHAPMYLAATLRYVCEYFIKVLIEAHGSGRRMGKMDTQEFFRILNRNEVCRKLFQMFSIDDLRPASLVPSIIYRAACFHM